MKRRQRGLTLVELMVTLAVAIILLAVGIPAFQGIEASSRLNGQTMALVTALNTARSEAVARGIPLAVCARERESDTECGDDWANGWLLFTDAVPVPGDCDGCDGCTEADYQNRTCDMVLKVFSAPRGRGRSESDIPPVEASADFVQFNSRGEPTGGVFRARSSQKGGSDGSDRCVSVGLSGQIQTRQGNFSSLASCP